MEPMELMELCSNIKAFDGSIESSKAVPMSLFVESPPHCVKRGPCGRAGLSTFGDTTAVLACSVGTFCRPLVPLP